MPLAVGNTKHDRRFDRILIYCILLNVNDKLLLSFIVGQILKWLYYDIFKIFFQGHQTWLFLNKNFVVV